MYYQVWTPKMIIDCIMRSAGREPINSLYYSHTYPAVYAAADRLFGGWGKAVAAAGFSYDGVRKYREWDCKEILDAIHDRQKNGEPLSSNLIQRTCKPLYMASIHHFGSWPKAIKAAGLDYRQIRQRRSMTREEIIREMKALYEAGEDLAYPNMRKNHQYLLAAGMKKVGHGSWGAARRACGISENFRLYAQRCKKRAEIEHAKVTGKSVKQLVHRLFKMARKPRRHTA